LGPYRQIALADDIKSDFSVSTGRACRILGFARSQYYYRSKRNDRSMEEVIGELADKHPAYGFRKLFSTLKLKGHKDNHKRVYRIYRKLGLNKKRKAKRRLPNRLKQPLEQQAQLNQTWSMDFMSDSLVCGRKFRTLNIIDDCNREALAIVADSSISAPYVTRTLDQVIDERGKPKVIRVDNGPEFTSNHFQQWCNNRQISIQYTQPGKPMQNGFIERFNGTYRREILNAYMFFELFEVRQITEQWIIEYNTLRPHESLENRPPVCWPNGVGCENVSNSATTLAQLRI